MDFDACRFDFRLDNKNGLTPSRRKKSERRNNCYNTLFKCKICGSLFDHRAALLEHKLVHNEFKCPICELKVTRKATLKEHLTVVHGLGKTKGDPETVKEQMMHKMQMREQMGVVRGMVNKRGRGGGKPRAKKIQPQKEHQQQQQQLPKTTSVLQEQLQQPVMTMVPPVTSTTDVTSSTGLTFYINVPIMMSDGLHENNNNTSAVSSISGPIVTSFPVPSSEAVKAEQSADRHRNIAPAVPLMYVKQEPKSPSPTPDKSACSPHQLTINPAVLTQQVSAAGNASIEDIEPGEIIRPPAPSTRGSFGMMQLPTSTASESPAADPQTTQPVSSRSPAIPTPMMATPEGMASVVFGEPRIAEPPPNTLEIAQAPQTINGLPAGPPSFASIALRCQDGVTRWFPLSGAPQLVPQTLATALPTMSQSLQLPQALSQQLPYSLPQTLPQPSTAASTVVTPSPQPPPKSEHHPRHHSWSSRQRHITYSAPILSPKTREGIIMKATQRALIDKIVKQTIETPQDLSNKHTTPVPYQPHKEQSHSVLSDVAIMQGHYKSLADSREPSPCDEVMDLSFKPKQTLEKPSAFSSFTQPQVNSRPSSETSEVSLSADLCLMGSSPFTQNSSEGSSRKRKRGLDSIMARLWETKQHVPSQPGSPALHEATTDIDEMKAAYGIKRERAATPTKEQAAHKIIVMDDDYQKCNICHQVLFSSAEYYKHIQEHAVLDSLICSVCDFQAMSQDELDTHHTEEHEPNQNDTAGSVDDFSDDSGTEYLCTYCGKGMGSASALAKHIADHENEAKLQFSCRHNRCGMRFATHDELWKHIDRDHFTAQLLEIQQVQNERYMEELQVQKHQQNATKQRHLLQNERYKEELKINEKQRKSMKQRPIFHEQIIALQQTAPLPQQQLEQLQQLEKQQQQQDLDKDDSSDNIVKKQVYVCPQLDCAQTFSSSEMLKEHYEIEHEATLSTPDRAFEQFGSKMTSDSPLNDQVIDDSETISCSNCNQTFGCNAKLWSHRIAEHDALQKMPCSWCSYSSGNRLELESHCSTTHGQELPDPPEYLCHWCGKTYISRTSYRYHMFRHNEDGSTPQYLCPLNNCTQSFRNRTAIKLHVSRAHPKPPSVVSANSSEENSSESNEANRDATDSMHVCNFPGCDKVFKEAKHLKVHRMLHTDEKPLKCGLCDYSCRQRNSMNWHMKSKHNKRKEVTPDGRTVYV